MNNKYNNKNNQNTNYTKTFAVTNQRPYRYYYVICNDDHKIYDCPVFKSKNNQEIIKFHFTPTYTPHFGGIWEVGVLVGCQISFKTCNRKLSLNVRNTRYSLK